MPKKFKGENSKAAEAKARKEEKRQEELSKKEKAAADAYWEDNDKHLQRKQQRKDEREKKRVEQLDRKKEAEDLLQQEMSAIKSAKPSTAKVTRADIDVYKTKEAAAIADKQGKEDVPINELPLEENINRLEEVQDGARTVDEAISLMSVKEAELDKHPEKRVKAAFAKYEEDHLPILKAENPNMRLSQLKQMLKKDWQKSPENPLNQQHRAYNKKS